MKLRVFAAALWVWISCRRPGWVAASRRLALPLFLVGALCGCVTTGGGSVAGGECKVFEAPAYAIRGATQRDQDWIDPTIESGIGGCHWARPAPRPAEWDAAAKPKVAKKRPGLVKRIKAKVWPSSVPPVVELPTVEPPEPEPVPAAPIPPRSVLDRLLHPSVAP